MFRQTLVRQSVWMIAAAAVTGALGAASSAHAQYVTYYAPSVAYYAPAPTVAYYAPAPAPVVQTVAYAPVAAPVAYAVASPVVAAPVVTYYRPPVVSYAAVPTVVTRYRPFLGGTVSRVRYGYAPVAY